MVDGPYTFEVAQNTQCFQDFTRIFLRRIGEQYLAALQTAQLMSQTGFRMDLRGNIEVVALVQKCLGMDAVVTNQDNDPVATYDVLTLVAKTRPEGN